MSRPSVHLLSHTRGGLIFEWPAPDVQREVVLHLKNPVVLPVWLRPHANEVNLDSLKAVPTNNGCYDLLSFIGWAERAYSAMIDDPFDVKLDYAIVYLTDSSVSLPDSWFGVSMCLFWRSTACLPA